MGRRDQLGVTLVAGLGSSEDFCTLMSGPWQGWLGLAGMVNQSAWGCHSGWWPLDSSKWGNTPGESPHTNSAPAVVGPPGSSGGDVDPPHLGKVVQGGVVLTLLHYPFPPFILTSGPFSIILSSIL